MGLGILGTLFLTEAWKEGARFDSTLTLGRLACFLSPGQMQRAIKPLPSDSKFVSLVKSGQPPRFMDDFFTALGSKCVETMDASAFEGASIIHDLNEPLPAHLHGQYDAVVDGGTLEHVFNVPVAFKNAMDAVKVGGNFFATLPGNNQCGHGFYQFSAEFFYRVFSKENGFEVQKLLISPVYAGGRWLDGPAFDVLDPVAIQGRVNIEGRRQMIFFLQAKKIAQKPIFATWPQQSDYSATWAGAPPKPEFSPANWWIVRKAQAVRRLGIRIREIGVWRRTSLANPALKPHVWKD